MIPVFTIADRADGHHHLHLWISLQQHVDSLLQTGHTLINGELLFLKKVLRTFFTIVHNLTGLFQSIDVIGAQRQEHYTGGSLIAFYRMKDADWIVHHAIRVDGHGKAIVTKAPTNLISEARADEKHLFARLYLKTRFRYVNCCPKLHQLLLTCKPVFESVISTKRALALGC